ncbi:MAG: preprotein translocase subunit SecE [Actinomycetota bacterium]|nr:preprotein translocase subunit SecE [Actinomycetota bacterium]
MASKREKQGEQSVLQADQRQKRSNNQSKRAASQAKAAKRSGTANSQSEKSSPKGEAKGRGQSSAKDTAKTSGKASPKTAEMSAGGVNREMKRMMKRREGAADRLRRPTAPQRGKRSKPLTFIKEVRGELGRVAWPTRQETLTYTLVVIVTVAFFMIVIGAIDYVALKGVLFLIGQGGR